MKIGDKVKVLESADLNQTWWGRTGVISAVEEQKPGWEYDFSVALDDEHEEATPLVVFASELELVQ